MTEETPGFLAKVPTKIVRRRHIKAANWTIHEIGYGEFEVRDFKRNPKLNYYNHTCECRKWQLFGLPCSHAIAVASYLRQRDCSQLASDYFSKSIYRATYAEVIQPASPPETWDVPSGYQLMTVKPPLIRKRGPGKPRNHDRIPSRGEDR